jgi:hypothetical protein
MWIAAVSYILYSRMICYRNFFHRLNYVFFVVICHALIVALCLHMTEIILEHQLLTRVHICLFSVFIDTCCVVVIGLYQAIV